MSERFRVAQLVGDQVKALREAAGRSQDELADAARRAGLDWTRAAVASLETRRRGLSAEELLLLPVALSFLDGKDHTLRELLEGSLDVTLPTGQPVKTAALRRWVEEGYDVNVVERQIAGGVGIAPSGQGREVVAYMAAREAERHVAKRL
jgi:transcriptional regulator with XRE-family HTH domain